MKRKLFSCGQNKQPIRNIFLILVIISVLGLLQLIVSRRHLENSMFSFIERTKHTSVTEKLKRDSETGTSSLKWLINNVYTENKWTQPRAVHVTKSTYTDLVTKQRMSRDIASKKDVSSTNNRSGDCSDCFQTNLEFLLDSKDICKLYSGQTKIDLIIMISSSPSKKDSRDTIRSTWACISKNNTGNVRHVFLFGDTGERHLNSRLSSEHSKYGDIIQGSFFDSYKNLTYKTMMGFKWVITKCQTAEFVMKTDDDMWVNIPALLLATRVKHHFLQTGIVGYCKTKSEPVRDPSSKWYVSWNIYPYLYYPTFCSGTGYLLSMHTARNVYIVSRYIPFFYLEDIYIAFCVDKLGYKAQTVPGFHSWNLAETEPCFYKSSHVITVHGIDFDFMKKVWDTVCHAKQ